MKKTYMIIAGLILLSTTAFADWTDSGWSGSITTNWLQWSSSAVSTNLTSQQRLLTVVGNLSTNTDVVTTFQVLTTYFGNGFPDTSHAIRTSIIKFMPGGSVNANSFRVLTGNGDSARVSLAVKSLLRLSQEFFIERNLTESMRANALFVFFLSYGSSDNLALANTSYSSDVFGSVGGATTAMRKSRSQMIDAAKIRNKTLLSAQGQSFVGDLPLANALVFALNNGTNVVQALNDLGVSIDETSYNAQKSAALQIKVDVLAGGVVNEPRLTMLEVFLGTLLYNSFVNDFNGTTKLTPKGKAVKKPELEEKTVRKSK